SCASRPTSRSTSESTMTLRSRLSGLASQTSPLRPRLSGGRTNASQTASPLKRPQPRLSSNPSPLSRPAFLLNMTPSHLIHHSVTPTPDCNMTTVGSPPPVFPTALRRRRRRGLHKDKDFPWLPYSRAQRSSRRRTSTGGESTGGSGDPPVHRPGLRLQRVQDPVHVALRRR